MTRKEGFIDLEKILKEMGVDTTSIETISKSPIIKSEYAENESSILLKIKYNKETYYFKYNDYYNPYNELLVGELANDFNLPIVSYDLAILHGKKGVISKSFRKNDASYIPGEDLLIDFGCNLLETENHNLENIWDALEYRYHNNPNKRNIIESIMNGVVSLFMFDILVCQNDRHASNWEIEEFWDHANIAPIYDNESIFMDRLFIKPDEWHDVLLLADGTTRNLISNILNFQKVSSNNYIENFKSKLWIIGEENLRTAFKKIEDKTNHPMPEEIKEFYLTEYKKHKLTLENVLKSKTALERDESNERKNR